MATSESELLRIAGEVIQSNRYLTLATSSETGVPWAAPLLYAVDTNDRFYWVSASDAEHSRNVASNASVALVIFNSDPGYGNAQALYCRGHAHVLDGDELALGCEIFYRMRYPDEEDRRTKGRKPIDFSGDSPRRMYRAVVEEYSILHPDKHPLHGSLIDHRVVIPFSSRLVGVTFP
jgi:nitroimidazol reductase NimA-like FMN-containing flavoprotein (pyridoxamine 5'-phosphate oxidase superfamily)